VPPANSGRFGYGTAGDTADAFNASQIKYKLHVEPFLVLNATAVDRVSPAPRSVHRHSTKTLLRRTARVLPIVVHAASDVASHVPPVVNLRVGFSRRVAAAQESGRFLRIQRVVPAGMPTALDDNLMIPIQDSSHVKFEGQELQLHLDETAHLKRGETYAVHVDPGSIVTVTSDSQAGQAMEADVQQLDSFVFTVGGSKPKAPVTHMAISSKVAVQPRAAVAPADATISATDGGSVTLTFPHAIEAGLGNVYAQPQGGSQAVDAPMLAISTLDTSRAHISDHKLSLKFGFGRLLQSTTYVLTLDPDALVASRDQGPVSMGPISFTTAGSGNCVVSPWSSWAPCPVDCDAAGSSRSRFRVVVKRAGGVSCPPLSEAEACSCAR